MKKTFATQIKGLIHMFMLM